MKKNIFYITKNTITDKRLKFLYLKKKLTISKIAKLIHQLGIIDGNSVNSIRTKLKALGILKSQRFKKELKDRELIHLFLNEKLHPRLIKKETNCIQSHSNIRRRLKRLDLYRNFSEAQKIAFETGRRKIDFQNFDYQYKSDLGHSVLSSWEANICRFLKLLKIKYLYEPKVFKIKIWNKITHYRPDIYLPNFDLWIEIKGWKKSFNMLKIKKFSKVHTILVIDEKIYRIIKEIFKDKIRNWE